jgi:hypothetical protein
MCKPYHNLYLCPHSSRPTYTFCPNGVPPSKPCEIAKTLPLEGCAKPYCCTPACCADQIRKAKRHSNVARREVEKVKGNARKSMDCLVVLGVEEEFGRTLEEVGGEEEKHRLCEMGREREREKTGF